MLLTWYSTVQKKGTEIRRILSFAPSNFDESGEKEEERKRERGGCMHAPSYLKLVR